MLLRELVKSRSVRVEKRRHLIYERSGAARAGTVHTLLQTACKVCDLRVLSAELHRNVRLRNKSPDSVRARRYLLHERDFEPLRHGYSARARDGDECALTLKLAADLAYYIRHRFSYVREMPLIAAEQKLIILTHDRRLNGSRADVKSNPFHYINNSLQKRQKITKAMLRYNAPL